MVRWISGPKRPRNNWETNDDLVVVAGHTGCGGAAAALQASNAPAPPIPANTSLGRFLSPMIEFVRSLNLGGVPHPEALTTVIEENVKRQVS